MDADELFFSLCCASTPVIFMAWIVFTVEHVMHRLATRGIEAGEFHCPTCRYNLRGIGSWQCPECGSDPRRVGVFTRDKPPLSLAGRLFLWIAAAPMLLVVTVTPFTSISEYAVAYGLVVALVLWLAVLLWIGWTWDARDRRCNAQRDQHLRTFAQANGLPTDGLGRHNRSGP